MRITKAKIEDAKEISDVYGMFYFISIKDMEGMIDRIVVIKKEKKIVGLLSTNKDRNTIKMLIVKKKERRNGYGKKLFEEGCKILKIKKKGMIIEATLSPTNSTLFWKDMGFISIKKIITKLENQMMIMRYKG